MDKSTALIYQDNLKHLSLYDLTNLQENYPKLLDMTSNDTYDKCPNWLKKAIDFKKFNINKYRYKYLISFVLELVDKIVIEKNELLVLVKDTIKRAVQLKGDHFKLKEDIKEDIHIKDDINNSIIKFAEISEETKNSIDNFWGLLNIDNKFRLIFLLGQIAKSGALGYHYKLNINGKMEEKNQSNEFFYTLTIYYAEKLKQEMNDANNIIILNNLLNELNQGNCIEVATNNLALCFNNKLYDVWENI
jgi:hypothetical protein